MKNPIAQAIIGITIEVSAIIFLMLGALAVSWLFTI